MAWIWREREEREKKREERERKKREEKEGSVFKINLSNFDFLLFYSFTHRRVLIL